MCNVKITASFVLEVFTMKITEKMLENFAIALKNDEKAPNTVTKYAADAEKLLKFAEARELSKELLVEYKEFLLYNYKPTSANSIIAATNSFLRFCGLPEMCISQFKIQRTAYIPESRELTRTEYMRLLEAAKGAGNTVSLLIMETIASTGIRVSELPFVTVESVSLREFTVTLKGKTRRVMMTTTLAMKLRRYCELNNIKTGEIFPVSRNFVWRSMKNLCEAANVRKSKVFPHNLRHLFARCFYSVDNDIVRLADVLGHSNINTTHIYLMTSGREHSEMLEKLGLVTEET